MPNCDGNGNDTVSFSIAAAQCERTLSCQLHNCTCNIVIRIQNVGSEMEVVLSIILIIKSITLVLLYSVYYFNFSLSVQQP